MRDLLRKAEHYRELAVKYHELAKVAQPTYLGDFYRGVAVRYVFMAQEASERAKRDVGLTAEPSGFPNVERGDRHLGSVGLDLDLLAVWAGDGLRSGESK
jgi:hypothetical protein